MPDGDWRKCYGPSEKARAKRNLGLLIDLSDDNLPEEWMKDVEDWRLSEPEEGPKAPKAEATYEPAPRRTRPAPKPAPKPRTKASKQEITIRVPKRRKKKVKK